MSAMPQRLSKSGELGDLSDEEILRALSRLLSEETQNNRHNDPASTDQKRKPKQIIGEDFSFKPRNQLNDEEKRLMARVESERQSMWFVCCI